MTIESIVKATMAKEIEEKLAQIDLTSIANKKVERHVKKFIEKDMRDCIRRAVSDAVKEYLSSWDGKREIRDTVASLIKISLKE